MNAGLLEWAVATLTLPGEAESGDRSVVKSFQGGALVAVVDGLGHGAKAAEAAKLAIATLEDHASEPVTSLIQQCHNALTNTRGVVMSLASFNVSRGNMTWLGVGNVEGLLIRAGNDASPKCQSLLLRSGVVGARLPVLQVSTTTVSRGDLLIFATDGIAGDFSKELNFGERPQKIADDILALHSRGIDDALVLVSRYLGQAS
ncbi:MAG TPA: SpoIIE family protein phosphatase [Terriglobia bacterium]|nr:SpoIIE family protein phosphatase [Terriglobia bacterium]